MKVKPKKRRLMRGGALGLHVAEPAVSTQEPAVSRETSDKLREGRLYWPADKELPSVFRKQRRELVPCAKCRRVRLDNGGQAVVCTSSGVDLAWFRCKICGARWKLGVEYD